MLRIVVLCGLLSLLPSLAIAEETYPFYGRWAQSLEQCSNLAQSDNGPEIIGADGVFGWEYSCDFNRIKTLAPGHGWRVQLACLDSGFKENWTEFWFLSVEDTLIRITSDGYDAKAVRCTPEVTTCTAEGGELRRDGILNGLMCFKPTTDAGNACTKASDCSGFCLADTGICSAETPQFGCIPHLDETGQRLTICID
jgi:hypothetical protein